MMFPWGCTWRRSTSVFLPRRGLQYPVTRFRRCSGPLFEPQWLGGVCCRQSNRLVMRYTVGIYFADLMKVATRRLVWERVPATIFVRNRSVWVLDRLMRILDMLGMLGVLAILALRWRRSNPELLAARNWTSISDRRNTKTTFAGLA